MYDISACEKHNLVVTHFPGLFVGHTVVGQAVLKGLKAKGLTVAVDCDKILQQLDEKEHQN